jgi:tetratricopeptide (TPR) repeat protein
VLLGDLLYSRNRAPEAVELWREALKANDKNFFALRDLGMALMVEGKSREGLDLLTRASVIRPEHLATTMLVTNLHARLGNADSARNALQRALDKDPGSDVFLEKLASVEAQLGNTGRALELLNAHTFEPTHQTYSLLHLYRGIRLMLALESYKNKNLGDALSHIRSAARPPSSLGIDDFATVASSRLLMFEALVGQVSGRTQEALASWKAAAETRDDDVEGEGLFRALALRKTGRTQQASEWLDMFKTVNQQRKSDNAMDLRVQAHCLAGFHEAFEGKDAQAAESFRKALEIDQSYLYARQGLAWLEAGLLRGMR